MRILDVIIAKHFTDFQIPNSLTYLGIVSLFIHFGPNQLLTNLISIFYYNATITSNYRLRMIQEFLILGRIIIFSFI